MQADSAADGKEDAKPADSKSASDAKDDRKGAAASESKLNPMTVHQCLKAVHFVVEEDLGREHMLEAFVSEPLCRIHQRCRDDAVLIEVTGRAPICTGIIFI